MSYAIELYFDQDNEAEVRSCWKSIGEAGLRSPMADGGYRPHISLAVYDSETLDVNALQQRLAAYAGPAAPLPLLISSVGIFPTDEGVLYLGVTPTKELIRAHAEFHTHFQSCAHHLRPYYRVSNWVPHCTLSFGLTAADCALIVPLFWKIRLPLQGQITEIGIAKVSPVRSELIYTREIA